MKETSGLSMIRTEMIMNAAYSDEWIMAYADGELDASHAASLHEAIRNDEALRRQYEIFLATRAILATAFDGILNEPVPDTLKAAVTRKRRPSP
jgi:anti-sigma factor RsiW